MRLQTLQSLEDKQVLFGILLFLKGQSLETPGKNNLFNIDVFVSKTFSVYKFYVHVNTLYLLHSIFASGDDFSTPYPVFVLRNLQENVPE